MAHRIWLDGVETLEDLIQEDLDVLFVGYNPNPLAVAERHYYFRKANRFWEDLHEAGFVPRVFRGPDEDRLILAHGLGLTDVIKRPTPTIEGLAANEFRAGFARLDELLARYRPRVVCFNGLGILARYARWGRPPEGTLVRAVPSTSPRNNGLRAQRLAAFKALKAEVDALKRGEFPAPEKETPMTFETVSYGGWPNCVRLANDRLELIATTDVGPRVIRLGRRGGPNLFKEFPEEMGRTGGDAWRSYGGHRLWHAPEDLSRTYWPDNVPVAVHWDGATLTLTQPVEGNTGLQKEIALTLAPERAHVTAVHRITNRGTAPAELAVWCLSVMAPGGRGIFPQEPYKPHAEALLPARPLVLWHYTDMADPRWTWGTRYIQLRQDPAAESLQKVGMMNTPGWAAYQLGETLFLKRFRHRPGAVYPDYGCSTETFTNADMLEVETLGPLLTLAPGDTAEHREDWFLYDTEVGTTEAELDARLLPLVADTEAHLG